MSAISETSPLMEIGMKNRMLLFLSALAMLAVVSCDDSDTTGPVNNKVMFTATMTPAAEVPAVTNSTGSGTFTAELDTVTNIFSYDVAFTGLSANVTVGHIHGPAEVTTTGNPIITFNNINGQQFTTGATAGSAHGTAVLNSSNVLVAGTPGINGDSLKKLLFAGKTYANVHTTGPNATGEIRGQITLKTP
jgi:hypothetical protein